MCTVTWRQEPGGYALFFNRDERKTRARAVPPAVRAADGVSFICPVDPEAGGTWLGVNEWGVLLGMMNYYEKGSHPGPGEISRGRLLLELLGALSVGRALAQVRDRDLVPYAPFILIALEPGRDLMTLTWDSHQVHEQEQPERPFLSTSAYDSGRVVPYRRAVFERFARAHDPLTVQDLLAFHVSRVPEPGPYAVCMERKDAQTWSLSHIAVSPETVQYAYADGPPCRTPLGEPVVLPRRTTASELPGSSPSGYGR